MVPYLSLVIPAYNEAKRLPPTLGRLAEFARGFTRDMEVLIVVEKSADGTLDIAREIVAQQADFAPKVRIIDNAVQRGKGFAVRSGMLQARGEYVFYMDADLSVPLAEVNAFLRHFEAHPEIQVLMGNRQHPGARITLAQSWLRRSMGQTFNRIIATLGMAGTRDTQCGFKAFRGPAAHAIFERQEIDGFAFDVEVLLLAERLGFKIGDLPVEWINSPESKVRIIRDSLGMLRDAVSIRRSIARRCPRGCGAEDATQHGG
jgi:dolichyl-phosphate beta-glucosyltransferase